VFGLILGTGIGGGICHGETLFQTVNGVAGEVGHMAISGVLTKEFNLPILTCGCGRQGCFETLASGPGMTRLAKLVMGGAPMSAQEIATQAASEAVGPQRVIEIWLRIVTELIGNLQLTIDPDCIVLGGGLSNIPNVCNQISEILPSALLQGASKPMVTKAKFGDSSGTRGAALAARRKADQA
jgi:N-acetylglucosamine kinase